MFDSKTMQAIDKLADEELLYSKVQHEERFASLHEAESIIREELEELEEEAISCRDAFETLHKAVRYGKLYDACDAKTICSGLRLCAQCAAAEAIQLAAMCKKLGEFEDNKPMCAHWDDIDGKTWCSRCGASNKAYKSPYCPHCGAKMMERKRMKTEIEWIPVGEKLPEPEIEVLVIVRDKPTGNLSVWSGIVNDKDWEVSRVGDYFDTRYTDNFEVTAWAHLPEAYKEGAD